MRHQCRDCLSVSDHPDYCPTCAAIRARDEQTLNIIETAFLVVCGILAILCAVALS